MRCIPYAEREKREREKFFTPFYNHNKKILLWRKNPEIRNLSEYKNAEIPKEWSFIEIYPSAVILKLFRYKNIMRKT